MRCSVFLYYGNSVLFLFCEAKDGKIDMYSVDWCSQGKRIAEVPRDIRERKDEEKRKFI